MRSLSMFLAVAVAATAAVPAMAADRVVKMLNKGPSGMMVFEPAFLKIAPGESVRFVATDKSHNAETIPGMLPPGAASFKGNMNQDVTVKFAKPGVYGVKCLPHYGLGMVALIEVGKPSNLAQAKGIKHPPLAQKRFNGILASVK